MALALAIAGIALGILGIALPVIGVSLPVAYGLAGLGGVLLVLSALLSPPVRRRIPIEVRRRASARVAAREVDTEIFSARVALKDFRNYTFAEGARRPLPASAWELHKGTLGRVLSHSEYVTVTAFYERASQVNWGMQRKARHTPEGWIAELGANTFDKTEESARKASAVLRKYAA